MEENINDQKIREITNPIIKGVRPIYYLITEEKLNDLIANSFVGSITFAFFSILMGAALKEQNWIYAAFGVIFLLISLYFYWLKIKFIHKTKKSGEIQSLKYETADKKDDGLKILKAIYGTPPEKIMDVTTVLNSKIADNKLFVQVINSILGGDPDKGINKTLDIEYRVNNEIISRRYKEYEYVDLP
jgi:hypothetical protein